MRKTIFAILATLMPLMAMATTMSTPQVIWTEGNTTLIFIYADSPYAEGDTFGDQTVTKVWSGTQVTRTNQNSDAEPLWQEVRGEATAVVFDESFQNVRPQSTARWFRNFSKLEYITGLEYLNTSEVKYMQYMFFGCTQLTSLDVSHFDTSNVTNMHSMFGSCKGLTVLDVSNFNTSKVQYMPFMFQGLNLTTLDLSSFDTSSVTDMQSMFIGSTKLTDINLSSFDTRNVTTMQNMFSRCNSLKRLDLSSFNTPKLTSMNSMFSDCWALESIDFPKFNTSQVTSMASTFNGCYSLKELDVSNFDTSRLTNLEKTFYGCRTLTNLDLSSFHTPKLRYLSYTFTNCLNLTDLDISNFDTSNVTKMNNTFYYATSLKTLDLRNFNTAKCTSMISMFQGCSALEHLDISSFKTGSVTSMGAMFCGCENLKKIDVSHFNTEKVTRMDAMFQNCKSLTELDVTNFNTEKVTTMSNMFSGLNIESLELRNFDTANCTEMGTMFAQSKKLHYLDLLHFTTPNNVNDIFKGVDTTFIYVTPSMEKKAKAHKPQNLIVGDADNGFTCSNCFLYDQREPRIPYPFHAEKVTYWRNIAQGGNGNTIVLPCDFSVPADMKAYQMRPAANQVRDNIIYFWPMGEGETMKACTPYLIANWGKKDAKSIVTENTDVVNTIDYYDLKGTTQLTTFSPETQATTLKDGTQVTLCGTFRYMPNSEVADQGIYIFQTGNRWKQVKSSNTSAYIPAYRAYLKKEGGTGGLSRYESMLLADDGEETTAITQVTTDDDRTAAAQAYDLGGRPVASPRKGTYIIHGKKIAKRE